MNKILKASFLALVVASTLSSCDKLKDLADPEYGDEKLVKLMVGGQWNIDSLNKKYEEQRRIITDSSFVNYGKFEFLSPDDKKNPGMGLGYLVRHFKNAQQVAKTDTTVWYPGNRDANESIENLGKSMTIYYQADKRKGYTIDAEKPVFSFVKRENNLVIIESWHRTNLSNGAEIGIFRRYKLSR